MPTKRQIESNRLNARKSTGPRTDAGKAVSSMNGLRHGLYAGTTILPGESQAEFDQLRGRLQAAYEPADPYEQNLVDELAVIEWKKRRIELLEAGLLTMNKENPVSDYIADYNRISLMQARISNAWFKLIRELQKCRSARKPAEKPQPQRPELKLVEPEERLRPTGTEKSYKPPKRFQLPRPCVGGGLPPESACRRFNAEASAPSPTHDQRISQSAFLRPPFAKQ